MAFPKHPIIDVTPVDAARGAAATAQAAAEPFMPPSFGKRVAAIPFAIKAMLPLPHRA